MAYFITEPLRGSSDVVVSVYRNTGEYVGNIIIDRYKWRMSSDEDRDRIIQNCLGNKKYKYGQYRLKHKSESDLVMRDDNYAEKLARGEYGNHIDKATEKVDPTIKENLTVDREYWRRVYAGEIMPVILSAAITTHAKIKDEYKGMPAEVAVARSAIALADALLEELEKTEKKL